MSSRKAANSASLLNPYKSRRSLHLWNDALIFILVFSLSNSCFWHWFFSSVFLFLLFDVGSGGAFFVRERQLLTTRCVREGGGAQEWLTLLRHSPWLWLVVFYREQRILANQITTTGWSHRQWIITQLTCISFYFQIIMTILASITKKELQTTALRLLLVSFMAAVR